MSREARDWVYRVMERGVVPLSTLAVLFALADHHNPKHGCFPSQKKLCARLHVSRAQLARHLNTLRQAGLIRITKRRRGIQYTLLMQSDMSHIRDMPEGGDMSHIRDMTRLTYETSPPENPGDMSHICDIHLNPVIPDSENPVIDLSNMRSTDTPCGAKNPDSEGEKNSDPGDPEPHTSGIEEPSVKIEEIVAKKMKPKTEAEVLAKVEKARKTPKGITPSVLGSLWRDLHEVFLPEFTMAGMTHVQMKQLAMARQAAGEEFVPTLVTVLRDWHRFRLYCKSLNVFPMPKPMPEVAFLLKNIQIAVYFHRERLIVQSDAADMPLNPVKPVPAKPAGDPLPEPAKPATLEEVQAILKGAPNGT